MYIIELFFKLKDKILKKVTASKTEVISEMQETDDCKDGSHMFIPIDSTGRVLACSKCGKLYILKDGEVNPFK